MNVPLVPSAFVRIVKGTLAKMSGEGVIPLDYVDLDFWNKIPRKFNSTNTSVIQLMS